MRVLCIGLLFAFVGFALTPLYAEGPDLRTKVHLKRTEPHGVATMGHKGPYTEVPQVVLALAKEVEEGGYYQAGPVMVAYFNDPRQTPAEDLLWEVRIPVAYPGSIGAAENDKMGFRYLDPMFVAFTYHIGPFDQVGEAYAELIDWASRNKYEIIGPPVEIYWSDPATVPAERWVTEIHFPILEKKLPGGVAE
jgi:AraC family transcriptional regulator